METEEDGDGDRGVGGVGGREGETSRTHISAIPTSKPNPTKPMGLHFQSLDI